MIKLFLCALLFCSPTFGFGQIMKATVGGIIINSWDQNLNWSQDFRLTLNLNLQKTNHHLILKKNMLQTSNAIEFSWGEPYLFASKNTKKSGGYFGIGVQKGFPNTWGSVVFFAEVGTSFPKTSLSFGVAFHPQLTLWQPKKSP